MKSLEGTVFDDPKVLRELERIDENTRDLEATIGMVELFSGKKDSIPKGYHLCDGHDVPAEENQVLSAILGSRDGQVRLPSCMSRFAPLIPVIRGG